jgi:hypothetical protein
MAKMFYTIEEVCEKLGKSEDDVKEMARSGQIQEFRDRDKLMFKVDQIDLLASGPDDTGEVHLDLEDTSGGSGLDLQEDSAIGLEESREGTGISVFDTDHGTGTGAVDETDDQTQEGSAVAVDTEEDEELSLESVGSGSGLLDLTRESDDTSLGAELLEEVYSGDENIEIPGSASGLFEAAGAESPEPQATGGSVAALPMVVESYDGSGSGLGAGLLLGALAALVCVGIIVVVGIDGATPQLAVKMASSSTSLMIWGGGLLAGTIVFGLVGLLIGKATE